MSGDDGLQKSADEAKYKKDSSSQHPPSSLQKILPFFAGLGCLDLQPSLTLLLRGNAALIVTHCTQI
jgi:hypothetical protein